MLPASFRPWGMSAQGTAGTRWPISIPPPSATPSDGGAHSAGMPDTAQAHVNKEREALDLPFFMIKCRAITTGSGYHRHLLQDLYVLIDQAYTLEALLLWSVLSQEGNLTVVFLFFLSFLLRNFSSCYLDYFHQK